MLWFVTFPYEFHGLSLGFFFFIFCFSMFLWLMVELIALLPRSGFIPFLCFLLSQAFFFTFCFSMFLWLMVELIASLPRSALSITGTNLYFFFSFVSYFFKNKMRVLGTSFLLFLNFFKQDESIRPPLSLGRVVTDVVNICSFFIAISSWSLAEVMCEIGVCKKKKTTNWTGPN